VKRNELAAFDDLGATVEVGGFSQHELHGGSMPSRSAANDAQSHIGDFPGLLAGFSFVFSTRPRMVEIQPNHGDASKGGLPSEHTGPLAQPFILAAVVALRGAFMPHVRGSAFQEAQFRIRTSWAVQKPFSFRK
jgi:hypothetical protein